MNEVKTSMNSCAVDQIPALKAKFESALSELIGMCHDAGLHSSEMVGPLQSELRWAQDATRTSDGG